MTPRKKAGTVQPVQPAYPHTYDADYHALLVSVQAQLEHALTSSAPLFTTDTGDLFDLFLAALPAEWRQYHTCNACRKFFERYGGLVTISEKGTITSAVFTVLPSDNFYANAILSIANQIALAGVTGVFVSPESLWGTPVTGAWSHLAARPPRSAVWTRQAKTAAQRMAELKEDFSMLQRALTTYTTATIETALAILRTDQLYRGEKVLGVAEWLLQAKQRLVKARGAKRTNIAWKIVATAPTGFCHVNSTMIGTLLDDIQNELPYDTIVRNFKAKMSPATYQRAQAAPATGTIQQAERLFAELGLEPSLHRRYARLDELPKQSFIWAPRGRSAAVRTAGGIFGRVSAKQEPTPAQTHLPGVTMTWEKFQRVALPNAQTIEVLVPPAADRFAALVTAAEPDAPAILQWDNPFSWYYASGIDAEMRRRLVMAGGRWEGNDIRCSLMWENYNDLDLHCITPQRAHIYYADKEACRYGGNLDVDMNVYGETDKPVENIRWARSHAPSGRYEFYVNLYRCHKKGPLATPFVVELEVDGRVWRVQGVTRMQNQNNAFSAMVKVAEFFYTPNVPIRLGGVAEISAASVSPNVWNVSPNTYVPVTAAVTSPNLWGKPPLEQHGKHAFFLLDGCWDTQQGVGRGFFVETLKSDLRPVRSVLEAYNASAEIAGAESATACGIGISKEGTGNLTVRVNGQAIYTIDRWD